MGIAALSVALLAVQGHGARRTREPLVAYISCTYYVRVLHLVGFVLLCGTCDDLAAITALRTGQVDWLEFWEKAKSEPWGKCLDCMFPCMMSS